MADLAAETAPDLEARLGLEPGALGTALIGLLGRLQAGLCIHESGNGQCLFANDAMANLIRRKPAQIVGHGVSEWLDAAPAPGSQAANGLLAVHFGAGVWPQSLSLTVDGEVRHFSIYQHRLAARDGSVPRLLCSIWLEAGVAGTARTMPETIALLMDDGNSSLAKRQLDQLATQRNRFDDRYRREIELALQEHREFAFAALGVDRFEARRAGSEARVARDIALVVERLFRADCGKPDALLHLDDGRFMLLFSGAGLTTAHFRAERLRRQCAAEPILIDGDFFHFTVSIGVASHPHTARDQRTLFAAATEALALASHRGGNQVALASIWFDRR